VFCSFSKVFKEETMRYDHLDYELLSALNEYERRRKSRGGTENEPVTAKLLLQAAVGELACTGMSGQMLKRSMSGERTTVREMMAAQIWDCGFGLRLALAGLVESQGFHHYLETIPEIPDALKEDDEQMPFLTLVDPRLPMYLICKLLDVERLFAYDCRPGSALEKSNFPEEEVYWVRHGYKTMMSFEQTPRGCLEEYAGPVVAASLHVGLFVHLHHQEVLGSGNLLCPETVLGMSCAMLGHADRGVNRCARFDKVSIDTKCRNHAILPCRLT
jgi:hypothetical protein